MNLRENFLDEETICGYTVHAEVKRIWAVNLDLLKVFQRFCQAYGLRFFIGFGTLLGAVRHHGFVPWDDDADLLMLREDFDRLKDLSGEFPWPYFLQHPDNDPGFWNRGMMKLRHSGTTCIQRRDMHARFHQGIGLDIVPLDFVPENREAREAQSYRSSILQQMIWSRRYENDYRLEDRHGVARCPASRQWQQYRWISGLFTEEQMRKKLLENATMYNDAPGKYLSMFTGFYSSLKIFHAEDFSSTVEVDFEHLRLPAPIGYDRCLQIHYGKNYSHEPPKTRKILRHSAYWATEIPYRESRKQLNDMFRDTAGKIVVLFGAGHMVLDYEKRTQGRLRPQFFVDNDEKKWGDHIRGLPVKNPQELLSVPREKLHVIICSNYFRPIGRQLRAMGIRKYFIYSDNRDVLFCPADEIAKFC